MFYVQLMSKEGNFKSSTSLLIYQKYYMKRHAFNGKLNKKRFNVSHNNRLVTELQTVRPYRFTLKTHTKNETLVTLSFAALNFLLHST